MTINIISTQTNRTKITGPKKVLVYTLKGLDKIGVKYVFNQPISEYKYNWIHDDQKAIIEAGFVGRPVIVGPNTAVLPKDLPKLRRKLPKSSIYLHPSPWCVEVWKVLGFNECRLDFWSVGIDLDGFEKVDRVGKEKILLYFKQRDKYLLEYAEKLLKSKNLEYELICYGFYKEEDYKKALKQSRFGIWIGCSESQGIGLQEALSTNLPLIVLDAKSIFDTVTTKSKNYFNYKFPKSLATIRSTTVPYFDERCGIRIEKIDQLENAIDKMQANFAHYKPREFIEENLSLKMSATKLISFFKKMNIENKKSYNYKKISQILFYIGLTGQKWAWKWAFNKLKRDN